MPQGLAEKPKYQPKPPKVIEKEKKSQEVKKDKSSSVASSSVANAIPDSVKPAQQKLSDPSVKITSPDQIDPSEFSIFDFEMIPENFTILISSPRGSGKTHLLKHMLSSIKNRFDHMYLFSETADLQEGAYDYCPPKNMYSGYDDLEVEKILNKNREIIAKNKRLPKKHRINNRVLLVLDDVVTDKELQKSNIIKKLFCNGRHCQISIIILLQNLSSRDGMATVLRKNADLGIFFSTNCYDTREMIGKSFISIKDQREGQCVLKALTEEKPYQCVVCVLRDKDGKRPIKKYSDYIFKYCAPATEPRKFMIGSPYEIKEAKKQSYVDPHVKRNFQFLVSGFNFVEVNLPTSLESTATDSGFRLL